MADFKKQGGVLTGREERYDGFEGEPRSVGGALAGDATEFQYSGSTGFSGTSGNQTGGSRMQKMENKLDPRVDSDGDGRRGIGK